MSHLWLSLSLPHNPKELQLRLTSLVRTCLFGSLLFANTLIGDLCSICFCKFVNIKTDPKFVGKKNRKNKQTNKNLESMWHCHGKWKLLSAQAKWYHAGKVDSLITRVVMQLFLKYHFENSASKRKKKYDPLKWSRT